MLVVPNLEQQIELLREQCVVIFQPVAEERKRVDERPASDDHLRPTLREQIDRGEVLEDPDRVGRAEHRDGTGEADALGTCRRRAEQHGRCGVEVVLAMVFANAKDVQANLVRILDLFDQVAHPIRRRDGQAGVVVRCRETIYPDFHGCIP